MQYLFHTIGGSGSTYLANELRQRGLRVDVRPDTYFVPRLRNSETNLSPDHQFLIDGYHDLPKKAACEQFYSRTGYGLNPGTPLYLQLLEYIRMLKLIPDRTAIFNNLRIGRFFSSFGVDNIIHIIRHPLHNFVSLCGHQHPEKVKDFGGLDTEGAVRYFADIWRVMVQEAIDCGHPVVRFEFAKSDFAQIDVPPILAGLFDNWNSGKRNNSVLSEKNELLLYTLVAWEYRKLYGDWEI